MHRVLLHVIQPPKNYSSKEGILKRERTLTLREQLAFKVEKSQFVDVRVYMCSRCSPTKLFISLS